MNIPSNLIEQAREWIADCDRCPWNWSETAVSNFVAQNYDGGIAGFVNDFSI